MSALSHAHYLNLQPIKDFRYRKMCFLLFSLSINYSFIISFIYFYGCDCVSVCICFMSLNPLLPFASPFHWCSTIAIFSYSFFLLIILSYFQQNPIISFSFLLSYIFLVIFFQFFSVFSLSFLLNFIYIFLMHYAILTVSPVKLCHHILWLLPNNGCCCCNVSVYNECRIGNVIRY